MLLPGSMQQWRKWLAVASKPLAHGRGSSAYLAFLILQILKSQRTQINRRCWRGSYSVSRLVRQRLWLHGRAFALGLHARQTDLLNGSINCSRADSGMRLCSGPAKEAEAREAMAW